MSKATGTVLTYKTKSGFGFITADDGEKVFAHWKSITSSDKWPRLEKGEQVEFTLGEDEKGKQVAMDITFPGGAEANHGEETKSLSKFRVTGVVKFFDKKGFGFIELNKAITWPSKLAAGTDVYVSREELDVAEDSRVSLWSGMEVEFNVYQREDKEKGAVAAANVTAPGGESLVFTRPERSEKEAKPARTKGAGKGKGKGKSSGVGVKKTIVKVKSRERKALREGAGKGSGKSTGKVGQFARASGGKSVGKSSGKSVGKSGGKSGGKSTGKSGGKSTGVSTNRGGIHRGGVSKGAKGRSKW